MTAALASSKHRTIVFLHGGGLSRWMWRPQIEALSSEWHCLAPDMPGHGEARDVPFTFDAAARHVADLIRAEAHGARAHVVGLSLGGQVALALLATFPDRVLRTVISGTSVRPVFGRSLVAPAVRISLPLNRFDAVVRANFRSLHAPAPFFDDYARDARAAQVRGLVVMLRQSLAFRLPAGLERATSPTLVLVGEREPKVVHRSAEDIRRALRFAEVRVIPRVHHTWNLEAPELFSATVSGWVR